MGLTAANDLALWKRSGLEVAPSLYPVLAGYYPGDGLGVGDVLLLQDAFGEGVGVVRFEYRDGFLENDDAVVEFLVDEMDGASGDLDAVEPGLLLSVEAGEGGQQRGMDVEDALRKGADEFRREQAHVSGENDEIDLMLAQCGDHVSVMLGAFASVGLDNDGFESALACFLQAGGIGFVGDDDGDFAVLQ